MLCCPRICCNVLCYVEFLCCVALWCSVVCKAELIVMSCFRLTCAVLCCVVLDCLLVYTFGSVALCVTAAREMGVAVLCSIVLCCVQLCFDKTCSVCLYSVVWVVLFQLGCVGSGGAG